MEKQTDNVDDCPVTNLELERFCGPVDYGQKKLKTLKAVSRSIVLGKGENQGEKLTSFRSFKQQALARREVELEWSQKNERKV